jgi:hypothetical protein
MELQGVLGGIGTLTRHARHEPVKQAATPGHRRDSLKLEPTTLRTDKESNLVFTKYLRLTTKLL